MSCTEAETLKGKERFVSVSAEQIEELKQPTTRERLHSGPYDAFSHGSNIETCGIGVSASVQDARFPFLRTSARDPVTL